jgi:hypothetical protein
MRAAGPVIDATVVSRRDWLHGEALCPSCRLPIDQRDVIDEVWDVRESEPVGAMITHKRCGATYRIRFE